MQQNRLALLCWWNQHNYYEYIVYKLYTEYFIWIRIFMEHMNQNSRYVQHSFSCSDIKGKIMVTFHYINEALSFPAVLKIALLFVWMSAFHLVGKTFFESSTFCTLIILSIMLSFCVNNWKDSHDVSVRWTHYVNTIDCFHLLEILLGNCVIIITHSSLVR